MRTICNSFSLSEKVSTGAALLVSANVLLIDTESTMSMISPYMPVVGTGLGMGLGVYAGYGGIASGEYICKFSLLVPSR